MVWIRPRLSLRDEGFQKTENEPMREWKWWGRNNAFQLVSRVTEKVCYHASAGTGEGAEKMCVTQMEWVWKQKCTNCIKKMQFQALLKKKNLPRDTTATLSGRKCSLNLMSRCTNMMQIPGESRMNIQDKYIHVLTNVSYRLRSAQK